MQVKCSHKFFFSSFLAKPFQKLLLIFHYCKPKTILSVKILFLIMKIHQCSWYGQWAMGYLIHTTAVNGACFSHPLHSAWRNFYAGLYWITHHIIRATWNRSRVLPVTEYRADTDSFNPICERDKALRYCLKGPLKRVLFSQVRVIYSSGDNDITLYIPYTWQPLKRSKA